MFGWSRAGLQTVRLSLPEAELVMLFSGTLSSSEMLSFYQILNLWMGRSKLGLMTPIHQQLIHAYRHQQRVPPVFLSQGMTLRV
jgi:hypothetical protein